MARPDRDPLRPTPALLARLAERARDAAAEGTFAVPELAEVAEAVGARGWLGAGASYRDLVRAAARFVLAQGGGDLVYVPKAAGDLEPMLDLFPDVLALPVTSDLSAEEMIEIRAYPVHVLGIVKETTWGDGRPLSPADYFFHDLDHARFKVREDLAALGVEIPDAYRDGTTIDPITGQHRCILAAARGRVGSALWDRAEERLRLARHLLAGAKAISDRSISAAALLLLFEIVHEKSFPLEVPILRRELGGDAHLAKIRKKIASGFYGDHAPPPGVDAALDPARDRLLELL